MNELSSAVGHLNWLASSSKQVPASRALSTYNTANRIRLYTFDEDLVSDLPAKASQQLRVHADRVSTAALQVLVIDTRPVTKKKLLDSFSAFESAIQKLVRCARTAGINCNAKEWPQAPQTLWFQEINNAFASQESKKRKKSAMACEYNERVASACFLLCLGLALEKDPGGDAAFAVGLIRVGAGILRSAHQDTDSQMINRDLVRHNRLAADILLAEYSKVGPAQ